MKRLAWATDIHLNFLQPAQVEAFYREVEAAVPDALLITGDIAEAPSVGPDLWKLAERLARPVYFVLGNHDFYGSSVARVRDAMEVLLPRAPQLTWLTRETVVPLSEQTGLVGHDSWADGRFGNGSRSPVMLNDFIRIEELAWLPVEERFAQLARLGDEAAAHFRRVLPEAFARFARVLLLTHVPPFREACWHEGQISNDDFLPHFACKAVGDVLREEMLARPDCDLTVLCGHTHGRGYAQILPNLRVKTGAAKYGAPALEEVLEVA
jgi:3',5'-cyclic AMP phosphodiesterase CpdA